MTDTSIATPSISLTSRVAASPFLLAAIAVLFVYLADAAMGFPMLAVFGADNDSQMRLVEVRDLLAGQSWFDLHQYRMGAPEGFVMHWSRFIDAPIAAIVWLATLVTGSQAMGETVGLVLWPALTFVAALYFVLRGVRAFAGEEAMVPAVVIAGITFYGIGIFSPSAIDHHNAQLALVLAVLAFLLESIQRPHMALYAGIAATLSLAIGMETVAYVAFAGVAVAGWYLIKGEEAARATTHFGVGFGATAIVALIVTKPPSSWLVAECDAYSAFQFVMACIGGFGIAGVANTKATRGTAAGRLAGLAVIGACVVAALLIAFPQCLAPPYSDAPTRLRDYWMSSIVEAQPIWAVIRVMPVIAANCYPPIIVALIWLLWRMARRGVRTEDGFAAAFLVSAALVSAYQLRGANFALGFAMLPLAAMVSEARATLHVNPSLKSNLRAIGAWLVSINLVWMLLTAFVVDRLQPGQSDAQAESVVGEKACIRDVDFAQLAAMPPARILGGTNLGAAILRLTNHHAFSGPYHRNIAGNLVAYDMLSSQPEAGRAMALDNGIDLVVNCPGNAGSDTFPAGSLQSELNAGRAPGWLSLIPETSGATLQIYRVVRN